MKVASVDFRLATTSQSEGPFELAGRTQHGTGLSFEDLRVDPTGKVAVGAELAEAPMRVDTDSTCAPANKNCN